MAVDPLSPIAPARVRVLVLPAGRIKKSRFMTFVDRLQHESSVRLGDISPDGRPENTMFSPLAFPSGSLLYNFSTSMPPPSHLQLGPFDLFREPMMVLGVADALEYDSSPKQDLERVAGRLHEQYPRILVSQLLVMDCPTEQSGGWVPDSAIRVPPPHASKATTMKTVMCDISARFLAELTPYAKAVQALPSVQSPGASHRSSDYRPPLDRQSSLRMPPARSESPASTSAVVSPSSEGSQPKLPPTSFDDITANAISGVKADGSRTVSRDRISVQAFGSTSAQERAKNKGKARVGIVIGNLYMLAGRWNDAWRELVDNTNKARTATDYLWYAKGLESLVVCMLLLIWAGFDFPIPAICSSGPDRTSSLISSSAVKDGLPAIGQQEPVAAAEAADRVAKLLPDLIPMIITIYEKTYHLSGEPLAPVAYSESVVRLCKTLSIVHNAGGHLDSSILHKVVSGTGRSIYQPKPNAGYYAGVSKHAIAELVFHACPSPTAGVPLADAVAIQSGIASVLSMLGLERKKGLVVKDIIASLVPALVQARKVGAAEMGIHPAASLSAAFGTGLPSATSNDRPTGSGDLLRDLHTVYGARDRDHLEPTDQKLTESSDPDALELLVNATIALTTKSAGTKAFGSLNLKVDILRACIDFCEALPDLPGVVHFAALLLRVVGPQGTMSASDPSRRVTLVTEEQLRLMSNMSRTINAASKIGVSNIRVPYWDDFLLRNITWIDDANNERLRERHKSDLLFDSQNKPGRSPFLYNPFAKRTHTTEEKIIVVAESTGLVVTLQNPYDFEVKIERLSLVTEGPALDVDQQSWFLGPARIQDVNITARAKDVGPIKIIGCSIQIHGCIDQIFPIYQKSWAPEFTSRVKELGLQAISPLSSSHQSKNSKAVRPLQPVLPQPATISAVAIQAQPHVVVDSISLSEMALMVLEGQRKTFQVTLHNTSSSVAVDFLHISFEDSLTASLHTALSAKELARSDMYELEVELTGNPTFTWTKSGDVQDQTIAPGEKATFDISVLGKPGLGAAKIVFDYAHLGKPFSEIAGRAFTRQAYVPIDITVDASIQLHRIDFAEFPADFAWKNQQRQRQMQGEKLRSRRSSPKPIEQSSDRFRTLLDRVGLDSTNDQHCLVLLDLRNAWPSPLTVTLQVRENLSANDHLGHGDASEEWKRAYSVHEVIHPGHIARLVLLLPRIHIRDPYAQIPILSLQNQRQFVVSADGPISPETERITREAFWFREEVLKYLRGTWEEKGSDRSGSIDLRGIRMSPRMVDTLRLQDIAVRIDCIDCDGEAEPVQQPGRSRFLVAPETLLTLRTTVHNRSQGPIRALLRLQPSLANQDSLESALDLGKRLMCSGLLQQSLPTIPPGGSIQTDLGVCPLVNGEFDVTAVVEETIVPVLEHFDLPKNGTEQEDFEAGSEGLSRKERRVWRVEEACRLVVAEGL